MTEELKHHYDDAGFLVLVEPVGAETADRPARTQAGQPVAAGAAGASPTKFCKDCAHYKPGFAGDGGSLLPGFAMVVAASCHGSPEPMRNLVTGERIGYAGDCATVRLDNSRCGVRAAWFVPATLDGRVAMLAAG